MLTNGQRMVAKGVSDIIDNIAGPCLAAGMAPHHIVKNGIKIYEEKIKQLAVELKIGEADHDMIFSL